MVNNLCQWMKYIIEQIKLLWEAIEECCPGPQGPQGPKGDKGKKGEKGDKGDPGVCNCNCNCNGGCNCNPEECKDKCNYLYMGEWNPKICYKTKLRGCQITVSQGNKIYLCIKNGDGKNPSTYSNYWELIAFPICDDEDDDFDCP